MSLKVYRIPYKGNSKNHRTRLDGSRDILLLCTSLKEAKEWAIANDEHKLDWLLGEIRKEEVEDIQVISIHYFSNGNLDDDLENRIEITTGYKIKDWRYNGYDRREICYTRNTVNKLVSLAKSQGLFEL